MRDCVDPNAGIGGIPSRSRSFWVGVAIVTVACLVRLPTLTWYSLNFDEGASLHFSSHSHRQLFSPLADLSIDRHPLTYCIMLCLPSALAGILTVAPVHEVGNCTPRARGCQSRSTGL